MGGFSTIGVVAPHYLSDTTIHLGSLLRSQLEYPTVGVSFAYLAVINKVVYGSHYTWGIDVLTRDIFTDKAVIGGAQPNGWAEIAGRWNDKNNFYRNSLNPGVSTADHLLLKVVGGTITTLTTEAVDIDNSGEMLAISTSGSTIKSLRWALTGVMDPLNPGTATATLSATDTSFASGYFGVRLIRETYPHGAIDSTSAYLKAPFSPLPSAQAILEVEVTGSGTLEDPYRPLLSQNMANITSLTGLPDFLYQEAKKRQVMMSKGFTDEEIRMLLGYVPQYQVDLDAVTWGAFEFSEKSSTNIIMITADNSYKSGAIQRQIDLARAKGHNVFTPPKTYDDVVALYNRLKPSFPHWLAGKDNFAYQVLGYEELEPLAVIDFYYGELIEHKTHYDQLKRVPDWELRNILRMWSDRLERAKPNIPHDEYVKHRGKLDKILRLGW